MRRVRITRLISKVFFRLYTVDIKLVRRLILSCVKRLEGGEVYSLTLRDIYSFYHKVQIGMYSYGGCFSLNNIPPGIKIGRYCSFASTVHIFNRNHPQKHKSLHPFFYNPLFHYVETNVLPRTKLTIGHDVWVGYGVVILPSVSCIGNGAVIGAGSIVTKDIPPFAVVAGNPAKIIKFRFSEEKIREIIETAWWENDMDEIQKDIGGFLTPYE